MRLREITETKQINEFVPLIGAIAATVIPGLGGLTIGAIVSAVFIAFTALDIYQYAVKLKNDPGSMEWYDWSWLVFDLYCMKGPLKSLSQQARKKIFDMIPDSAKKGMGEAVKEKVMKEVGKDAAGAADDIYKPQPRRNRVDSVPGTKAAEPATQAAPKTAPQATPTPTPKNPNLIDRPFKKEELMRLAGLAK